MTAKTEIDEFDFHNYLSDKIADYDFARLDNNQESLEDYLEAARQLSWDIDSALAHPCHKDPEWDCPDIMYEPDPNDPTDKRIIDHFKELHGLDLLSPTINWSFDT